VFDIPEEFKDMPPGEFSMPVSEDSPFESPEVSEPGHGEARLPEDLARADPSSLEKVSGDLFDEGFISFENAKIEESELKKMNEEFESIFLGSSAPNDETEYLESVSKEDPEELDLGVDLDAAEAIKGMPEAELFKPKDWFGHQKKAKALKQKIEDSLDRSKIFDERSPDYQIEFRSRRILQSSDELESLKDIGKLFDFKNFGGDTLSGILDNPEAAGLIIKGFIAANGGQVSSTDCTESFSQASKLLSNFGSALVSKQNGKSILILLNMLIKSERLRSETSEKTNLKSCFQFDTKPLKRVILKAIFFRKDLQSDFQSKFEIIGLGLEAFGNIESKKFEKVGHNFAKLIKVADKTKVAISDDKLDKASIIKCLMTLSTQSNTISTGNESLDDMIDKAKNICLNANN
jgi:hypothetical protein